jgi:hypothetical protein
MDNLKNTNQIIIKTNNVVEEPQKKVAPPYSQSEVTIPL